ncbi:hypothetical protein O181_061462 [Austropuccinia psidii MF-1]|uniref:Uncharacterized protein n=1 Tax=Austropuccinia psidii MF-1 TaxID=1389203 RepID=A0A9Q3EQH2_9BASI|nr:hypothetical protein [Austropuccinia psidii MF-1]
MEILHQHQQSQTPEGSPKCDIWDDLVWRRFTGTRNIHDPSFMAIPGALAFSIYVDWFNAHGKSTRGSAEIPSFDADYIPSELDISALSDHKLKGEALEHLQQIISDTIIPSSWTRVPHKMGSPSHGSLNAAEWALLYKVYIPFLMLSQQMLLHEHKYTNTQRRMGQSEKLANELTKNTFHLISSINIATSWTFSTDDANAFAEHWRKFCLSNQNLFPKQNSNPNHHFADYIPKLFQRWGPAQASAVRCGYETLIKNQVLFLSSKFV